MHHILNHWSGGDGKFIYDIYSGIGPFILSLGFLSGLYMFWKKHSCHDSRCFRLARHPVAEGEHLVCGRHYKVILGLPRKHRITVHSIKRKHEAVSSNLDSESQQD